MAKQPNRRESLSEIGGGMRTAATIPHGTLAVGPQVSHRPRDVLFIAIDNASPQRFGCWGNTVCRTPNVDKLASQGLRFDRAYSMVPICNPSRTSLLTSLRPETTKVYTNLDCWRQMMPGVLTMPQHFRNHGYQTVSLGKIFHRGTTFRPRFAHDAGWSQVVNVRKNVPLPRKQPQRLRGQIELFERYEELKKQGKPVPRDIPFRYGPSGLDDLEELDGMAAELTTGILKDKQEQPLFLALGFHRPGLPFTAPDRYFRMYPAHQMPLPANPQHDLHDAAGVRSIQDHEQFTPETWRETIAAHYACLTFIDAQVGRVLKTLDELGRAENTIVVLWSDHGFMLGEHFMWRHGRLYEESDRVPLIIKAPGVTTPGTICQRPVESIDIFPTLFELCGIPAPQDIEGTSMKPLLENPAGPWKKGAIIVVKGQAQSICTERWRYTEYDPEYTPRPARTELYDHETDAGEQANLAKDPKYASVVAELSELLCAGPKACLPDGTESHDAETDSTADEHAEV